MPKRTRTAVVVKRRTPKTIDRRPTLTARLLLTHNVRSLLSERGLNQTELARRMGRSQPYISQILNGKRGIAIEALDELADNLGVSVEQLFQDPLRAPARHIVPEETAVLDGLRLAGEDTREAIRLMLHLPKATQLPNALTDAAQRSSSPTPAGSGNPSRDDLVSLLSDAIEAATIRRQAAAAERRDRPAARATER